MDLIKHFEAYYFDQNMSRLMDLFDGIMMYDYRDFSETMREVAHVKAKHVRHSAMASVLKSNGSSGLCDVEYLFGPHFEPWRRLIERVLRGYDINLQIIHEESEFLRPFMHELDWDSYMVFLNYDSPANRQDLGRIIDNLTYKYGYRVSLCGKPSTWVHISTHPEVFEDLCSISPHIKSLINEDWELWTGSNLLSRFYLNDQMIDWRTGINFYTCPSGERHFLPLFHLEGGQCSNLLNLCIESAPMSDWIEVTDVRHHCSCGVPRLDFRFRSHHERNLDIRRSLIDDLKEGYKNLQFIGYGGATYVLYHATGDSDGELLRSVSEDVVLEPNALCYVGRKRYNFWKTDRLEIKKYATPTKELL